MKFAPIAAAGAAVMAFASLGLGAAISVIPTAAAASDSLPMPARVENFTLSDQTHKPHELYSLKNAKAVVIVTQGVGCPISRNVNPTLIQLQKDYAAKGVQFLLLNSNVHDDAAAIASEAKEFGFTIPVLLDTGQKVGEQLAVTRTATVYVIDPSTWKIAYRGPIDDRVTYERQRATANENWAKDALDVVLTGQGRIAKNDRPAEGCLINFEKRDGPQAAADPHAEHSGH